MDDENLSPFEAGRRLEQMTKDFEAGKAAERAAAVADAERQALAHRERVSKISPEAASARIKELTSNPQWRERWLAGSKAEKDEMADLIAAKVGSTLVEDILDGSAMVGAPSKGQTGAVPIADQLKVVETLRGEGIEDGSIRHALEGRPVSQAEHDATRRLRDRRLADPEWAKQMLAGHPDATRELHLMSIILASPIAESAA